MFSHLSAESRTQRHGKSSRRRLLRGGWSRSLAANNNTRTHSQPHVCERKSLMNFLSMCLLLGEARGWHWDEVAKKSAEIFRLLRLSLGGGRFVVLCVYVRTGLACVGGWDNKKNFSGGAEEKEEPSVGWDFHTRRREKDFFFLPPRSQHAHTTHKKNTSQALSTKKRHIAAESEKRENERGESEGEEREIR